MQLQIYKNSTIVATPAIDEQTVYSGEHMGMDKISASFITSAPVKLAIDDYVLYDNKQYKIKHATSCVEIDRQTYKHQAVFYGEIYDLYDTPLSHLGRTKFSYTGTPLELLGLIVDCLNEWFGGGWSIGDVELIDEPETFVFDEVSCRVALTNIAEVFKLEYKVENKKIYLVEHVGVAQNIKLKYGRGQGLQMISREAVDQSFATVWRFYGGNKNIPANYRNGMDRITVDSLYEINTNLYGRKGGSVTFEDVFPQRTSEVESIPEENSIIDTTIDFDISESYLTDGSAKILFKTGELGGNDFVITGYNHNTNTIRFGTKKEEDTGYELPNEYRQASVGDKYTLIGIEMPQSYLDAAEAEVQRRGKEHAAKNSHPPVSFPLLIDEKYIREMGLINTFRPGDSFHVISESLGVNSPLRLQSISFPLVNPANVTGVISDVLQYTTQERIVKDMKQNKRLTSKVQKSALYARQVADEVANAAIMHQFKKTYVGERAILTGAIGVGNPEDGMAAVLTGAGTVEYEGNETIYPIILAIGDALDDLELANFIVRKDGSAYLNNAYLRGEIEALRGKIGKWEISDGGMVNNDGQAYVIARQRLDNGQEAVAMIGANVLSATTGLRAVGLFRNTEINPLTVNYGIIVDVQNGYRNIGIKSNAPILNEGFSGGFSYYEYTPTSGDNTINPRYGNNVNCYINSSSFQDVYLPVDAYITAMLGVASNKDYSFVMTVANRFDSQFSMILRAATEEGWSIKKREGNVVLSVSNVTIQVASSITVSINKKSGVKWIQVID